MSTDNKIRVLHLITGLSVGGVENVLTRLVTSLSPDFESLVVSLTDEGVFGADLESAGISVRCLNFEGVPSVLGGFKLHKIMRQFRPDIVHAWMYHACVLSMLAKIAPMASSQRPRIVWSIHNTVSSPWSDRNLPRITLAACRLFGRQPDAVLYVSQISASQHIALGINAKGCNKVIPNGIDCAIFRPHPELREVVRAELSLGVNREAVISVARWHAMKDHANLLAAMRIVVDVRPQAVLLLVGTGLETGNKDLMALIHRNGLSEHVRLLGQRRDIPALLSAADLFVNSSFSEALPCAVAEAMASATACIVTDAGDSRALVAQCGSVVPVRSPPQLAEAILGYLGMPSDERGHLGMISRARIQAQYSLSGMISQYEQLYKEISAEH